MLELDQHFLKDSAIVKKAVAALDIAPKDRILEIGPGKGIITAELADNAHNVTVIEIDNSFNQYLVGFPKVKIIYGNALEEIKHVKFDKLISNIPFSISEPLLKRLMHIDFKIAVLFISKSFYELTDKNSRWAVIMPIFFEVTKLADVPKQDFEPEPKVNSVLLTLKPRKDELKPIELLVKEIFLQDDKKLKNALMYALQRVKGITKKESKAIISELDIEIMLDKNVDVLSNDQFNILYSILSSKHIV